MKVILLADIKGIGKKGDIIDASDGHARNYLLPKKLGIEANKANLNKLEQQKKSEENKKLKELTEAKAMAEKIQNMNIRIAVKSGENGKLFGSVTSREIASALEEQAGFPIDKKKISLTDPIKATGKKNIEIKLHPEVTAKLSIEIITE